ncbi:hypothetical protein H0O03_01300 [Candidatus Micrarchaeota archaeon]|nr:hypothetical protein [Candidatus Micrarchaeota archaeon]
MEKNLLYALAAVIVVAIVALALFATAKPAVDPTKLAQCLTEKGWTMYGTTWCDHCKAQKEMFGNESFQYVDFVDCDQKPFECQQNGAEAFPTWLNRDGSIKLVGRQALDTLASEAGC